VPSTTSRLICAHSLSSFHHHLRPPYHISPPTTPNHLATSPTPLLRDVGSANDIPTTSQAKTQPQPPLPFPKGCGRLIVVRRTLRPTPSFPPRRRHRGVTQPGHHLHDDDDYEPQSPPPPPLPNAGESSHNDPGHHLDDDDENQQRPTTTTTTNGNHHHHLNPAPANRATQRQQQAKTNPPLPFPKGRGQAYSCSTAEPGREIDDVGPRKWQQQEEEEK
jgi:hypothetical protein